MSKKDSEFQVKFMSFLFRGKEIFKPLNTGFIDERVSCIREYVANIYFYTKDGQTIMIDAGYNYDRLAEKMQWLDISPKDIKIQIMLELLKKAVTNCLKKLQYILEELKMNI